MFVGRHNVQRVGVRPRMELRECFGLEAVIVVRQIRAATGTIPDGF